MDKEIVRKKITYFLQWNDKNGCYNDENYDLEDIPRMYYEEVINYTKENGFFEGSDHFSFGFQESGVLINDRIYTTRYTPQGQETVILGKILQSDVGEEFYLGEELDRWTYMKGAKT